MRGQVEQVPAGDRLVYRLLLAVDVVSYSRLDAHQQLRTQTALRSLLDACAASTGLEPSRWHRQVRGDGELVVLPPEIDITRVIGDFTREFEWALAELNTGRAPERRLRVRLAMHHGTLIPGPLGPAGDAPVVLCRLLDATPLREFLAVQPHRDLALIVSNSLYQDVVRTGFCPLDPADFTQIRVVIKEVPYCGYIYHSGDHKDLAADRPSPSLPAEDHKSLTTEEHKIPAGSLNPWIRPVAVVQPFHGGNTAGSDHRKQTAQATNHTSDKSHRQ